MMDRRTRIPENTKQMVAGLRKKGTLLLRDMVIHTEPMIIRNKLNKANIAPAICKLFSVVFLNMTAFSPEV